MPDSPTMTDRVLDQVTELTRDYQPVLVDLAARLEPYTQELVEAWVQAYREAGPRQPLSPEASVRSIQERAVQVLFSGLKQGNLRQYFGDLAEWARDCARSGLAYDRLLGLVREYQRAGFPFLRRIYPVGPEARHAFRALDELYAGTITLLGAVYLEVAREQLIQGARLRTLGELAMGATHSLNNLLTSILGHTQLLLEHTRQPEARNELNEIQRAATASAQMMRRLQDLSPVGEEENFEESDLNALVREASEITRFIWRDQSEVNGIVVDLIKDLTDVPPILARPSQLREALVALILNAIEAMPRGGMITMRTERKADNVLVSVIDTGDGMPEDTKMRVFDPFFTTKGAGHAGVGLSVVTEIVARHNGAIHVESELGRGTTLTLSLPIAPSAHPEPVAPPTPTTQPVSVLVIDDEAMVRDVIVRFLRFRGYPVTVAESGQEGVAAFKRQPSDLVVTDLGMPGMSGWEVAREVKRFKPKTLVVLMTGWASDLDPKKVKESGVDRLVHKPFDVDDMLTLVNQAAALREKM